MAKLVYRVNIYRIKTIHYALDSKFYALLVDMKIEYWVLFFLGKIPKQNYKGWEEQIFPKCI